MGTTNGADYSEAIVIPREIPEHMASHFEALRKAKRVIRILGDHAESTSLFSYTIPHGKPGPIILPSTYNFDGFQIRFLPGWGTYTVTIGDNIADISIKIPHGKDEFDKDLVMIGDFIKEYRRAATSRRRDIIIAFQNKLRSAERGLF